MSEHDSSGHYFGSDEEGEDDRAPTAATAAAHGTLDTPIAGRQEGSQPSSSSARPAMDDELICRIFGSMDQFRRVVLGGGPDGVYAPCVVIPAHNQWFVN